MSQEQILKKLETKKEAPIAAFKQVEEQIRELIAFVAKQYYERYLYYREDDRNIMLAIQNIETAINYQPNNPHYHIELGCLLLDLDEEKEPAAHRSFSNAARCFSESEQAEFYHELAKILIQREHSRLAQYYCEESIKLNPSSEDIYHTLIKTYKIQADDAETDHEKVEFLRKISSIAQEKNDFAKVKKYLAAAKKLYPENSDYHKDYMAAFHAQINQEAEYLMTSPEEKLKDLTTIKSKSPFWDSTAGENPLKRHTLTESPKKTSQEESQHTAKKSD